MQNVVWVESHAIRVSDMGSSGEERVRRTIEGHSSHKIGLREEINCIEVVDGEFHYRLCQINQV